MLYLFTETQEQKLLKKVLRLLQDEQYLKNIGESSGICNILTNLYFGYNYYSANDNNLAIATFLPELEEYGYNLLKTIIRENKPSQAEISKRANEGCYVNTYWWPPISLVSPAARELTLQPRINFIKNLIWKYSVIGKLIN